MNAIRYFEWGGGKRDIPYCKVRLKNFFALTEGRKFIGHIPLQIFESKVQYSIYNNTENVSNIIRSKKTEMYQEGNDFIWNVFIKAPIKDNRTLVNIALVSVSDANRWLFFNMFEKWPGGYISGRKIKEESLRSGIHFDNESLQIAIASGLNVPLRFEDNNEAITLSSLLGKEIVFELI
jgi:hypothetical protein